MKVVQDQALSLSKDRQIVSVKKEGFIDLTFYGKSVKSVVHLLILWIMCDD